MSATTFFGLPIIDGRFVKQEDIAQLPFYDFWRESAKGSTAVIHPETQHILIWLHDWEAFCRLFIRTGKHRYQP